jgi:eukaryotic-like serine/threonine-protein kinase
MVPSMSSAQYAPGHVLEGTVYRVIRHLATGGMGSVYDVEDVTVEKRYVLKTLHPQLVSREDLARRMRDEAKSLAKLQHPNIVDVITAGVTTDAQRMPFYVMERLIGQNLRVVLEKRGALEAAHAYRIGIDVADALEHAHEHNLVHRDVKPENIFLHRNNNGTTTTKLLDFGIVRLLDRKASHTHGKFIGTLRYASPEQITGRPIGPTTDIYSLGLVIYEMLCGRGPFDDAGDQYAIGSAHAGQPPPSLSRFARVPPEVERFVASMLAKAPEERPRDCFVVASELRRFLRTDEQVPRMATEVNVLSAAVPSITQAGTTQGAPNVGIATGAAVAVDTGPTMAGMIPPSAESATRSPTTPVIAAGMHHAGPVSPVAPTLAAAGLDDITGQPRGGQRDQAQAPRVIDRNAPTRMSAPLGATQRLAQNDTRIEAELANDDDLRAAFGETALLVVPPTGGGSNPGEIVFPPMHSQAGTGPVSGEARTRPPSDRGSVILVVASVATVAVLIGGAYLLRAKPWRSAAVASSVSPPTMTATASVVPATPPLTPTAVPGAPVESAPATAGVATSVMPSATTLPARPLSTPRAGTVGTGGAGAPAVAKPVAPPNHAKPLPTPSGYSPAVKFE